MSEVHLVLSYLWTSCWEAPCWKDASVHIFTQQVCSRLHSLATPVPFSEQTHNQRCPSLITTLKKLKWMPLLQAVHSVTKAPFDTVAYLTFWACCVNRGKNCTLFIFLIADLFCVFFFFMMKTISQNSLKHLDSRCKSVKWPFW